MLLALVFLLGFAYAIGGLLTLFWASDKAPWLKRWMERDTAPLSEGVAFIFSLLAWPVLTLAAVPAILARPGRSSDPTP